MTKKQVPLMKRCKYRIYPNKNQREYLSKVFGSCRWIYNHFLAENKKQMDLHKEDPNKNAKPNTNTFYLHSLLPGLKSQEETLWLKETPAQVLQQSCSHLNSAFSNFFKHKKGYPKFKNKNNKQSATYTNQVYSVLDGKIRLTNLKETIKVKWDRELPSDKVTACTIIKTPSGEYYASFVCEYIPVKTSGTGIVGIDAGITDLFTISDGTIIDNPRHFVKSQKKLARYQRQYSRKKKGSANKNKARIKVAKLHQCTSNQRSDYLHKLSTKLVSENQAIGIESLMVQNMVRNKKLSKHIAGAGWGMFREQLKYKAVASGHCRLFLADSYFPSTQLCSHCGKKPKEKLKLSIRKWTCNHCNTVHQRDMNAAKNLEILATSELYRVTTGNIEGLVFKTDRYISYID